MALDAAGAPVATGNPLLDNPQMKAALMAQMNPPAPPPPMAAMPTPGDTGVPPALPATPQPKVVGPSQSSVDQNELARKLKTGSGISQIAGKIENSHLGQSHPTLGKILGIGAQGLAELGDIGLRTVAPAVDVATPGTSLHHEADIHAGQRQVAQDTENEQRQATTAETNARTAAIPEGEKQKAEQIRAELAPHGLQMDDDGHITPVPDEQLAPSLRAALQGDWKPVAGVAGQNGEPLEYNEKTGMYRPAPGAPGASVVATDKTPKSTKEQLQAKLVEAENKGDKNAVKTLTQQIKDIDPEGQQRIVVQEQGQANANQRAVDAKTEREYQYTRQKWDKDLQTYQAQNEKLQEANSFVGRGAMGDAIGSIKALSGLASGSGSGVRITQAELNSIAHARGFSGDFQAYLQKFGDGRNLTPAQEKELKGILGGIQGLAQAKETVLNKALDDLGNAGDIQSIRKIDSQVRHVLMGGGQ